jgi:hypothetical protein
MITREALADYGAPGAGTLQDSIPPDAVAGPRNQTHQGLAAMQALFVSLSAPRLEATALGHEGRVHHPPHKSNCHARGDENDRSKFSVHHSGNSSR